MSTKTPSDQLKMATCLVPISILLLIPPLLSCGPIKRVPGPAQVGSATISPWRINGPDGAHRTLAHLSGIAYLYQGVVPLKDKYGFQLDTAIVNVGPENIAPLLDRWEAETDHVQSTVGTRMSNNGYSQWTLNPEEATGFWHVASTVEGMEPPLRAYMPGTRPPPDAGPMHQEILRFAFSYPYQEKEVWQLNGPLQENLYLPLKHLLSTCAICRDPEHPDIRPELDIPVIVGKDANGNDIIQMKPLITKVVKDDGQPIQVFTGDPKKDQYFDKKFNAR